jgi:maleamate amidohydrolase
MADLDADYRQAGFGGRLEPGGRPALLVIDVVRAYLDPTSPLYADVEAVVQAAVRLRAAARAAGVPVLLTRVAFAAGGADGGVFYRKVPALEVFQEGGVLGAFPDELAPEPGDVVVTKQYASAFFGTSLAATLTAQGIDTLLITGLTTSGCVRATTVDAVQHGFVPLVVREAVGDRDERPHEANLFDLQQKYAEVVSVEDALGYLARIGSTEEGS